MRNFTLEKTHDIPFDHLLPVCGGSSAVLLYPAAEIQMAGTAFRKPLFLLACHGERRWADGYFSYRHDRLRRGNAAGTAEEQSYSDGRCAADGSSVAVREKRKLYSGNLIASERGELDRSDGHFFLYIAGDILFGGYLQRQDRRAEKSGKIYPVCHVFPPDCTGSHSAL